jgi:hypothetical protein
MPIEPFLSDKAAFNPDDIRMVSQVLDEVCNALKLNADATAREVVAIRIIELTGRGEHSAIKLRDRLLAEAKGGTGC